MTCEHAGCDKPHASYSVLGGFCLEHMPTTAAILRADHLWRSTWWDRLSEPQQRILIDGKGESPEAQTLIAALAAIDIRPPTREEMLAAEGPTPEVRLLGFTAGGPPGEA